MFERASRIKLRFQTQIGPISHEDLWDLPLTARNGDSGVNLNDIAKGLYRTLKEDEDMVDFVKPKSNEDSLTQLRFDIVKAVIEHKITQIQASEKREITKARNEQIKQIIANKQAEELADKSIDELKEMIE